MARRLTGAATADGHRRDVRSVLMRSVLVLGGATVVGLNETAIALGQVYAQASKAIGVALMTNGIGGG